MSFDVNWDIDKHREEHESDDHWQLRRNFMERWKQNYPEERLVCLARVFANIEFMGCRYPQEVMQEVATMSKEVNKHITYSNEYSAKLPDSSNAQGYTSAQYLMHRNGEETTQGSVSLTIPVDSSRCADPTYQEYGERSLYSTEAMQALLRIPEVLRTPYCNSFIYNTHSHNTNNNPTVVTEPLVGENSHQNQPPADHLLSWQSRDPRIQASASVRVKDTTQQDEIKSIISQAYQGMHTEGTHNVNEYECLAHSSSVNAQICNSSTSVTPGYIRPVQDQMMRSNYFNNADETNQPCYSPQHDNVATASSSEQFTLTHQKTYSNLPPQPLQTCNESSRNSNNAVQMPYSKANPRIKPSGKAAKGKIMIGDNVIKGPRARRYAYWLNAGKTQAEADYLSHTPIKQIPEYNILKNTLGTLCQLKRLKGSTIPVFKQHLKSKKKLKVEESESKTASSTIMAPSTKGLAGRKEEECMPHSSSIDAQSSNSSTTMTPGYILPRQDQIMRSNYFNNADETNTPCYPPQHDNVATASSSEQFTLTHQKSYGNLPPQPLPRCNESSRNSNNAVQMPYYKANIKPSGKAAKGKIMIGDNVIKGPRARRYAYWLNAGKTQAEADYLSHLPIKQIPEYHTLKHTLGTICQLKRLRGSAIPVFKQHLKSKNTLQVEKHTSKTLSSAIMAVSTKGLAGCKTRFRFWLSIGKTEEEARILCKRTYKNTPLAQELKAKAEKEGKLNTWTHWAVAQYRKSLEAKSINLKQPEKTPEIITNQEKAEIATTEDSDIEITTNDPEMIVISDSEENDKLPATDTRKNSAENYVGNETQMKRFNWWMHQGKSEEEATVLSQTPMAISNALNYITNNKQMQEKNEELNVIKTQIKERHSQMTIPDAVPLKDKWLTFKAIESRNISSVNKQNCSVSATNATAEKNHLKIYIKDVKSNIVYDQALLIRDAIAQCVSDYDGIGMPTCGILLGAFVAICTDEESRDWLDKQIPTLQPWQGAQFKIVNEPIIPTKAKKSVVYGRFYIPDLTSGLQENSRQEDVLEKLHEQNPKLGCKDWIILKMTTVMNGRVLLVLFRKRVHNALNSVGYMIKWYSRTIHVKLQPDKDSMKNTKKVELLILDPPNIAAFESASSIFKDVSTLLSQAGNCVVESPYNMAEEIGMTPGSIISNEGTVNEISNDMTPILVAPEQAGPSNSLAMRQESEQAASNYDNAITPQQKKVTQPTSTEQASQSTHRSLTMPNVLKQLQVGRIAGSWGIDTPRLHSGHKIAIALLNDSQGCSDSDDARLEVHYYREVRPFSGQDEEYSLEERVAARVLNGSLAVFKKQRSHSGSVSAERIQECPREERVFDEQERVGAENREIRLFKDFPHQEQALARQSQKYSMEDRVFDKRSQEYPKEKRILDKQNPETLLNCESRFDQRDTEYSMNDRRIREPSLEVFDEHEGTSFLKNRAIPDSFQQEGFRRTLDRPNQDDSEEIRDIRHLGNSGDDRYKERNSEYLRNNRDFVTQRQEYPREVFDEHEGRTSFTDGIVQDFLQEERAMAGPSQEYSKENRVITGRKEECSRENQFSESQSLQKYHEDRFEERNTGSPKTNRDFVGSHQEYPRVVFDEHDRRNSWKATNQAGQEQVSAGQRHEYSNDDRRQNREYSGDRFSDPRISENYEGRFYERDAEYSRNDSVLRSRVQEYPREERIFHAQERKGSLEDVIDSHDSHEERILSRQSHEYSEENRFFDRQSREISVERRFDERNEEHSRNYGVSVKRRHKYQRKVFDEPEGSSSIKTRDTQDFIPEKHFCQSRGFDGLRQEGSVDRYSDRRSPEVLNSRNKGLYNRHSPNQSGRFDKRNAEFSRNDRVFERDERNQEYSQERGLAGRFKFSPGDNVFDPRKGRNFDERYKYSRKHRDAGRDQKYSSVDRDRQRDEQDQARGSTHGIWPPQASKRPKWCLDNKSNNRSRWRGSVELQFTHQDEPRFMPRKKRSRNLKKK